MVYQNKQPTEYGLLESLRRRQVLSGLGSGAMAALAGCGSDAGNQDTGVTDTDQTDTDQRDTDKIGTDQTNTDQTDTDQTDTEDTDQTDNGFDSLSSTTPPAPDWAGDMVFYQLRLDTFARNVQNKSPIEAAEESLSYLDDLGINGIMINPVTRTKDAGEFTNHFGPTHPLELSPMLGTPEEFKSFVSTAHSLGIRVLVDFVLHGVDPSSELVDERPELFETESDGDLKIGEWGTVKFDWENRETREWYKDIFLADWVDRFDIDGLLGDLEPDMTGYTFWENVREEADRAIFVSSEGPNSRNNAYHMGLRDFAFNPPIRFDSDFFRSDRSLVETVQNLEEPYYSLTLSTHNYPQHYVEGRLVYFGFALLSPFIPIWRMGEEFNARNLSPTSTDPTFPYDPEEADDVSTVPLDDSVGQTVSLPVNCTGIRVKIVRESSTDTSPDVTIRLFNAGGVTESLLEQEPMYEKQFTDVSEEGWYRLPLEPRPPNGEYVVHVASEGDGLAVETTDAEGPYFYEGTDYQSSRTMVMQYDAEEYGSVLYFSELDWASLEDHRSFWNQVRRLLEIRHEYGHLIQPTDEPLPKSNIVDVPASGTDIECYARAGDGEAVIAIGKLEADAGDVSIDVSPTDLGMSNGATYEVTNLLDDSAPADSLSEADLQGYQVDVDPGGFVPLYVEET